MKSIRSRLSYTNVMSTIAVFGVLAGGGAWEASKIGTNDIKKGAVTVKKLHQNAVTTKKIKDNAVTGDKVNEPTLGQVPSALLGGFGGSSANVFCNFVTLRAARSPPAPAPRTSTFRQGLPHSCWAT